jgi:glyoxylase-like metal-dependent hydrolase (beta-lactamase superfamily II)
VKTGGRPRRAPRSAVKIADGVFCLPVRGANVYLIGNASSWVLVDAGWRNSAARIREQADALFGAGARPDAILITHAHPDHVGSALELAAGWDSAVYVPAADLPLLSGELYSSRTDALDPMGRLLLPAMRLIPEPARTRMNRSKLADVVTPLPADGTVPGLPGWRAQPTPGHTPGHTVFVRTADRVVIAGDAVVTAPLGGMLVCRQALSRPFWLASWDAAATAAAYAEVAALEPSVLATGHGAPMKADVAARLHAFATRHGGGALPPA